MSMFPIIINPEMNCCHHPRRNFDFPEPLYQIFHFILLSKQTEQVPWPPVPILHVPTASSPRPP